jgi:hemerythrin superfamily protein
MSNEQRDVIEILSADHREVEAMSTELETLMQSRSGTDDQLRPHLVDQVTIDLVHHAVAEEVVVYRR